MENQDKHDRFSIRKLSIGAASVLIGFAFVTGVGTHTTLADELNSGDQQPTAEVKSAADARQGVDTEVKNDNQQNGGQDVKTDQVKPEAAKGATPKVVAPVKTPQDQVAGTKIEQSTDKQEERQVSVAKDNQNGKQEEKTTTLATQSEVVNKQAIGSEEKADSNQVIKVQNLVSKKEFAVGLSQEEKTVKGTKKIALAKANAASESVVDKLNSGKSLTDSELESEMNKFNDVLESGKKLTDLPADQQAEFDSLINYIKNDHTFRPVVLSAMHNATIYFATSFGSGIVSTTTISVPDDMIKISAPDLISKYRCSLPKGYTFGQTNPIQTLVVYWSIGIKDAWCLITPKYESATVHYVVDDDLSRSIPDRITGDKYRTRVNYSSLVPSDYTLASQGSYTFTDAANQSFTIHLNEGTRAARPDDGGTSAGDYSKTVTRSFNVIAPAGHTVTAPSTQSITLTRSGIYNEVTDKVTFGNWSMGNFTAVTAPTITGYTAHASANNVDETIGGGPTAPSNEIVTITYTINEESATVHYVDDDDLSRSIPDRTTGGKYGTRVNYSSLVPSDYTLASQGSYTFTDAANQSFTIHLNEGTRAARPDDGGTSAGDYSKTVTRSFNVIAPAGHTVTAPSTQSITLTRSGIYNEVTDKVTFGNWSMGNFTAVTAPTITGYTAHASANNVDETIGGGPTAPSNEIVTITYTINEESATVHYVDDDDLSRSIPDGTTSGNYGTSAGENNSTSTVNTNNNDSEEPTAPVTYQQLVLYIGKHGRIVKKGYITVSEDNDSLTEMFRLAKVKSKMPKGYKATGKIKKVAKYLYVWVTKKNQPSFNEAPRTKDVLYVAKNGKIVKRTRITGSVRKLAKSKLPKGYKISGIDRINNHYDVWIKKEK